MEDLQTEKSTQFRDGRQSLCPPNQLDFLASNRCVPRERESGREKARWSKRRDILTHLNDEFV